ncbi:MAG: DUF3037 domain-containing protein [Bacteroidia bacterium]
MQNNQLFEYAVIRLVPRVEREEFINVGVILFCKQLQSIEIKIDRDLSKLPVLDSKADIEQIRNNLFAFERIAKGEQDAGPIAKYAPAERFRWLTATRSTIVQCSKIHPGFCEDLQVAMQKIFDEMVN